MIKLYSVKKTERILAEYDGWIETVSKRYAIPSAMIKAVLRPEKVLLKRFRMWVQLPPPPPRKRLIS